MEIETVSDSIMINPILQIFNSLSNFGTSALFSILNFSVGQNGADKLTI